MRPWELQACGKNGPRCQDCGVGKGKRGSLSARVLGADGARSLSGGKRGLRPTLLGSREGGC